MKTKTYLFVSVSLLFVVLFAGCSKQPKPTNQRPSSMPSWYLNPPLSNGLYMYGTAIGKDKTDAVNNALSSIVSTLSVNIKSSYNSKIKEHNYYTNTKIINRVEAKTSLININNYTIIKAVKTGYKRITVLVRVNKQKFVNGLISQLNSQKKDIDIRYDALVSKDSLERYNTLVKLMALTKKMRRTLSIVDELSPYATKKFDRLSYLSDIIRVQQRYISQKSALNFFIISDKKAYGYKEALKNYISQQGFNVSKVKTKNSVSIKISLSYTVYNSRYMNIAVVKVLLTEYENSLHVGGKSYTFKQRYFNSALKVYQGALISFTNALHRQTISKALGLILL